MLKLENVFYVMYGVWQIEAFELCCNRKVVKIRWVDRKTNEELQIVYMKTFRFLN